MDAPAPVSMEQAWFLERQARNDNNLGWTIAAPVEIIQNVKPEAVKAALAALQTERPELTTRVVSVDGDWQQIRVGDQDLPFTQTALPLRAALTGARSFVRKRFEALNALRFEPETGPLWRAELVVGRGTGVLLMNFCSLVADGDTVHGLTERVKTLYAEAAADKPLSAKMARLDYADYAHWQQQCAATDKWDASLEWWRDRLAGGPPDYWNDGRGAAAPTRLYEQDIGTVTGAKLEAYAAAHKTSPYAVMLTVFMETLAELDGGDDLWVTSPMGNRFAKGSEEMAGPFARLVVLRHQHKRGEDNLEQVQRCLIDTAQHNTVPHRLVVKALEADTPDALLPFRYVCNYRQISETTPPDAGEDVVFRSEPMQTEHVREEDLLFMVLQSGDQRMIHWYMRNDRFSGDRARDVMAYFLKALLERLGPA